VLDVLVPEESLVKSQPTPSIVSLNRVYDDGRAATKEWAPISAFRIGILWFAVIAVVTGSVALFRHELNSWL
jgi:hypothetical protein